MDCTICAETYDFTQHRPKLLPCDHTACKTCIRRMGRDFLCPVCRYHVTPQELVGMTTDFMALELSAAGENTVFGVKNDEAGRDHVVSDVNTDKQEDDLNNPSPSLNPDDLEGEDKKEENSSYNAGDGVCADEYKARGSDSNSDGDKTPTGDDAACDINNTEISSGSACDGNENVMYSSASHPDSGDCVSPQRESSSGHCLSSAQDLDLDLDCKFSNAFDLTAQKMQAYESVMEAVRCTKEEVLDEIEAEFDRFTQLVLRRKQLLRNQVLKQYEEKLEGLEEGMEKVTFTTMCLTSLHKHSDLVFTSHSTEDEGALGRLNANVHKVESEIEELVEQLSESGGTPEQGLRREGFLYVSHGAEEVERGIRTLGKVRLKELVEIEEGEGSYDMS